jgi:hypothetical protein
MCLVRHGSTAEEARQRGRGAWRHRRPVLDRLAHVGEHPLQVVAEPRDLLVVERGHLNAHPALDEVFRLDVVGINVRAHLAQDAESLPPYHHDGVGEQFQIQVVQVGDRDGDRVDRNGMSSVTTRNAVRPGPWLGRRLHLAGQSFGGQAEILPLPRRARLAGRAADQIFIGHQPPEPVDQCGNVGAATIAGQRHRLGDQTFQVGHGRLLLDVPAATGGFALLVDVLFVGTDVLR